MEGLLVSLLVRYGSRCEMVLKAMTVWNAKKKSMMAFYALLVSSKLVHGF